MGSVKHLPPALCSLQMLHQKKEKSLPKAVMCFLPCSLPKSGTVRCLMTVGLLFFEGSGEEAVQHV